MIEVILAKLLVIFVIAITAVAIYWAICQFKNLDRQSKEWTKEELEEWWGL